MLMKYILFSVLNVKKTLEKHLFHFSIFIIYLFIRLVVYLFIYFLIYIFVYLSIYLFIYLIKGISVVR